MFVPDWVALAQVKPDGKAIELGHAAPAAVVVRSEGWVPEGSLAGPLAFGLLPIDANRAKKWIAYFSFYGFSADFRPILVPKPL